MDILINIARRIPVWIRRLRGSLLITRPGTVRWIEAIAIGMLLVILRPEQTFLLFSRSMDAKLRAEAA